MSGSKRKKMQEGVKDAKSQKSKNCNKSQLDQDLSVYLVQVKTGLLHSGRGKNKRLLKIQKDKGDPEKGVHIVLPKPHPVIHLVLVIKLFHLVHLTAVVPLL